MRPINHHPARRRAGVLAMAVGIALLTGACGGGSSGSSGGTGSTTGRSSAYQKALAFAQCMRAHGLPNFPDPNSSGQFIQPNSGGGSLPRVSPAQLQAANNHCKGLLPNGGSIAQQQRQALPQELKFARCMRSHGVPNFPDPKSDGEFDIKGLGINPQSPEYQSAQRACQSAMPAPPAP